MNSQELETAVRLNLDLVVVVINDNSYGMIRWKQSEIGFEDFGLNFKNPDFVRYAQSYGAEGVRIDKSGQLIDAIEEAFRAGGVYLIDLPIDYSENHRVFNEELKNRVCLI